MTPGRVLAAVAAGLLLAALPFVRYGAFGRYAPAHRDHESHHGGQLGMVGDHHLELVRRGGEIEAFVSDAWRRPLHPSRARVVFDRREVTPLEWRGDRLVGADRPQAREIEAVVVLADGTELALSFDFSDGAPSRPAPASPQPPVARPFPQGGSVPR